MGYHYEIAQTPKRPPDKELPAIFGRNVCCWRRAEGFQKSLLARMAGISRPYLNEIEDGIADVRLSTVQRLADALSVSPLALLRDYSARGREHDAPF